MSPGCSLATAGRCVQTGADAKSHLDSLFVSSQSATQSMNPVFVKRAQTQRRAATSRKTPFNAAKQEEPINS